MSRSLRTARVFPQRQFLDLFWVFGMGFGVFIGFSGLINQIVIPLGFTPVRESVNVHCVDLFVLSVLVSVVFTRCICFEYIFINV